MTRAIIFATAIASVSSLAACKTGSPQQRTDIVAAMSQTQRGLSECYQYALARNRQTPGGFLTVEFIAEAGTGQFKNVLIRRDEINDPVVRQCVVNAVSSQRMAKPPDSNVTIAYAFRFTPTDAPPPPQ
jgi:hypothetical protein